MMRSGDAGGWFQVMPVVSWRSAGTWMLQWLAASTSRYGFSRTMGVSATLV